MDRFDGSGLIVRRVGVDRVVESVGLVEPFDPWCCRDLSALVGMQFDWLDPLVGALVGGAVAVLYWNIHHHSV